jgi:hypothetical protein
MDLISKIPRSAVIYFAGWVSIYVAMVAISAHSDCRYIYALISAWWFSLFIRKGKKISTRFLVVSISIFIVFDLIIIRFPELWSTSKELPYYFVVGRIGVFLSPAILADILARISMKLSQET